MGEAERSLRFLHILTCGLSAFGLVLAVLVPQSVEHWTLEHGFSILTASAALEFPQRLRQAFETSTRELTCGI